MGTIEVWIHNHALVLTGDIGGLNDRDVEIWNSDSEYPFREGFVVAIIKVREFPFAIDWPPPHRWLKVYICGDED